MATSENSPAVPAVERCPPEIWMTILNMVPDLFNWQAPKENYYEAWNCPAQSFRSNTSTRRSAESVIEEEHAAWLTTMTAICSVCSSWYVEMRCRMDEWLLFRSRHNLIEFLKCHDEIDILPIKRLDIHFEERYPDTYVVSFIRSCSHLEALYFGESLSHLTSPIETPLLEALAETCAEMLKYIGGGRRGPSPEGALYLLCGLPRLERLAVGVGVGWEPIFPGLLREFDLFESAVATHPVAVSLCSLRIELSSMTDLTGFLFSQLRTEAMPSLRAVSVYTIDTSFALSPDHILAAKPGLDRLEPFFVTHGAKLTSLQLDLADHGHYTGYLCNLVEHCPNLVDLAIPACKAVAKTRPLPALSSLRRLAIQNVLHVEKKYAPTILEHWFYAVGIVRTVVSNPVGFSSLVRVRCADVAPSTLPVSEDRVEVHQAKLVGKILEICGARAAIVVEDCSGRALNPEKFTARWKVQTDRTRLLPSVPSIRAVWK